MNQLIIENRADFQRHLNGCERRLEKFSQSIDEFISLSSNISSEQLKNISDEEKSLATIFIGLDQSIYRTSAGRKRLQSLQRSFEHYRKDFERLQMKHLRTHPTVDYRNSFDDDEEQSQDLLHQQRSNVIELEVLQHDCRIINRLEDDLTDLHGTFHDLNRIINEQGHAIDNIEEWLTNTDERVHDGCEQLETAVQQKQQTSRTKTILIIISVCLVLLLILIFYLLWKFAFPFSRN